MWKTLLLQIYNLLSCWTFVLACVRHRAPLCCSNTPFSSISKCVKWVSQTSSRSSFRSGVSCLCTYLTETFQHFMNDVMPWTMTSLQFFSHLRACYPLAFLCHSFHFGVSIRPIHSVKPAESSYAYYIWRPTFKPSSTIHIPAEAALNDPPPPLSLHSAINIYGFLTFASQETK